MTKRGSIWSLLLEEPLYWLLAALPLAIALEFFHVGAVWVFAASGVAIVPLAGLMGRATEHLAESMGPAIGGLLNATFGNAAELIIALVALSQGPAMYPLVKASITGSIIGNALLVLGLSITLGGLYHRAQHFNRTAASMGSTLLALATIGLIIPTLYFYIFLVVGSDPVALAAPLRPVPQAEARDDARTARDEESQDAATARSSNGSQAVNTLSTEIAGILAGVYLLSLVFSLGTHRGLFGESSPREPSGHAHELPGWSRRQSLLVLLAATVGVAIMSELLVGSVQATAEVLGMSTVFVGVIVVAIVGNAAEHSTAVLVAMKDKMDLSVNIAIGSSLQIALLVAPVLVFASMLMGHDPPLDLHFTPMEVLAVTFSVAVLSMVCDDGETHWFEGVMLLAVYAILALAFYHLPEPPRDVSTLPSVGRSRAVRYGAMAPPSGSMSRRGHASHLATLRQY